MPSHDPFPSISPFYSTLDDEGRHEPELIVDPLSGFVVAVVPSFQGSARSNRHDDAPAGNLLPWRTRLNSWFMRLGGHVGRYNPKTRSSPWT